MYAERNDMYYYAMLDSSNIVTTTLQSNNAITASNMIPITEQQYTSGDLIGKYYDTTSGEFVEPTPSVLADMSTTQINHNEEWLADIIDRLYVKVPKRHTATSLTTLQNHGITKSIASSAYGNGVYVFATYDPIIYTSTDLVTFTSRTLDTTDYMFKVIFYNGCFFGATASGEMLKSTDGITWTKTVISLAESENINYCLAATSGKLATITDKGKVYVSSDMGATWENVYTDTDYTLLSYIGSEFVLFGKETNSINTAITSNNATTWVSSLGATVDDVPNFSSIESNGKYIVGIEHAAVWTSTDGITWKKEGVTLPDHLHSITFVGNVAYISAHRGYLLYNDLKNIHDWRMEKLTTEYLDIACDCNGTFIVLTTSYKCMIDNSYETKLISEV